MQCKSFLKSKKRNLIRREENEFVLKEKAAVSSLGPGSSQEAVTKFVGNNQKYWLFVVFK